MKIKKTISVTASREEIELIGNFIALFDEMDMEVWNELNESSDYRLESAIPTIQEVFDTIDCADDD